VADHGLTGSARPGARAAENAPRETRPRLRHLDNDTDYH
jgi:hypothetical protein